MLMRYDPLRQVDQLLQQTWGGNRATPLPLDAYRRGDDFIVEFDLPGVDRDSVDLTVERDVLEVTAQRAGRYADGDDILIAERPQGTVTRQVFLGEGLDAERITASYDDGVLTVTLPVAEHSKPRKIEIGAGAGQRQAVEAGAA